MLSTLRSSHGLQRFMLLLGLGLVLAFLLIAIFAPWIAPYDFNADRAGGQVFGRQQDRQPSTGSARPSAAPTCCHASSTALAPQ